MKEWKILFISNNITLQKEILMMKIIAFTGKMRSGKDTASEYLSHHLHLDSERFWFSYKLKEIIKLSFNWSDEYVYGDLKDKVCPIWGVSPRTVMEILGTDYFREIIRLDFWIKHMEIQLKEAKERGIQCAIITDCRLDNEAEYIKSKGGIIVKIIRDNRSNSSSHKAEDGINEKYLDVIIDNNGSYRDLNFKIRELADNMINNFSTKIE